MSYQEIKKISRGRIWVMISLLLTSCFIIFSKKIARAQNIYQGNNSINSSSGNTICTHFYTYTYLVNHLVEKEGVFVPLADNEVLKCDPVKANIEYEGLWEGTLTSGPCGCACGPCGVGCACGACACGACGSPPIDWAECNSLDECLSFGTEGPLSTIGTGKGVIDPNIGQTVDPNNDQWLECGDGVCIPYSSGSYSLTTPINSTTYYGQCIGTTNISLSGPVNGFTDNMNFDVINRPPLAIISSDKNEVWPDEVVNLYCDVTDPDCYDDPVNKDKIVKVEWKCYNENNEEAICEFENDGVWEAGESTETVPDELAENPARFTTRARFTNSEVGDNFKITCEAWDNDPRNSLSSMDNLESNSELFVGVIPASAHFCVIADVNDERNKEVCKDSITNQYKVFTWGVDDGAKYTWDCDNGELLESSSGGATCKYTEIGTHIPKLSINDGELECQSRTTIDLKGDPTCSVQVRKAGTSDDYSSELDIDLEETVEAKITKSCIDDSEKTTWNIINGTIDDPESSTPIIKFEKGEGVVDAIVGLEDCKEAKVRASDKLRWVP